MAVEMTFLSGDVAEFLDHTPSSAVAAGQVVLIGYTPCIAHLPIAANTLGAVAFRGGLYTGVGDAAIAAGKKVYWDDSANKVTETTSGNHRLGICAVACTGDGLPITIEHDPDGA